MCPNCTVVVKEIFLCTQCERKGCIKCIPAGPGEVCPACKEDNEEAEAQEKEEAAADAGAIENTLPDKPADVAETVASVADVEKDIAARPEVDEDVHDIDDDEPGSICDQPSEDEDEDDEDEDVEDDQEGVESEDSDGNDSTGPN